ncbi:MAG: hypothetical protein WC332_01620 [Clostridia bacterium]
MSNLTDIRYVKDLQNSLRIFDSEQGKEVMKFLESIGGWTPNIFDTLDTNEVIARDANRRLIGTIKTLLTQPAEVIVALAKKEE